MTVNTDPKTADLEASIQAVAETITAHCAPLGMKTPGAFGVLKSAMGPLLGLISQSAKWCDRS